MVVVQTDKLLGRGPIDGRRDLPCITSYPPAHPPYHIALVPYAKCSVVGVCVHVGDCVHMYMCRQSLEVLWISC